MTDEKLCDHCYAGLHGDCAETDCTCECNAPETADGEWTKQQTRYVVFDADWRDPPGTVIKVFGTREAARAFINGQGDGYGYSIVEVPEPEEKREVMSRGVEW